MMSFSAPSCGGDVSARDDTLNSVVEGRLVVSFPTERCRRDCFIQLTIDMDPFPMVYSV